VQFLSSDRGYAAVMDYPELVLKRSMRTALRLVVRSSGIEITKRTSEAVQPPYISDKRGARYLACKLVVTYATFSVRGDN
jgi:hypothetical protein